MISYTSFNNALQNLNKSHLEFDKIPETLKKYPYFNVLKKIQESPDILDFFASQNHTNTALNHIYGTSQDESTVNYNYQNAPDIRLMQVQKAQSEPKETTTEEKNLEANTEAKEATETQSTPAADISISGTADLTTSEYESVSPDAQLSQHLTFSKWLQNLKANQQSKQKDQERIEQVKAEWQQQRILEMQEDDPEPINDAVFNMIINSVTENEEIISEPLAELYLKQGHNKKAISIYQKLILKYPDKSAYFAGLIRKLEN